MSETGSEDAQVGNPGPLRYLSADDVMAAMPSLAERLELAERTMTALVADADLPPKVGVHPRPSDSFGHAMPAWLRGPRADGAADLLGMKWVVGFPDNTRRGWSAIHGTVLLSDALSGLPRAMLDAGPITSQRTAAVSGVAIRAFAPPSATRVAVIGAGVQARSHLPVVRHLLPGAHVVICDRDRSRADALASEVTSSASAGSMGQVSVTVDARAAVDGSDVVVTLVSFGPERQSIPAEAFAPGATIVAVDYDMCVPANVARAAALFLVDDRGQFLANRRDAAFRGYPDPSLTIGEALIGGTSRPDGRVLVSHLGVGLADVVFGDAILRAAEERGIGTLLSR